MTSANIEQHQQPQADSFEVGWLFVQEYYTYLNRSPDKLHCFYNKRSAFSHGNEADHVNTSYGQAEIHKVITSLGFENCKVLVSQVDSQLSSDGGIIVQVLGEMSNKGGPSHKFAQTFFLAKQPAGYFVLNDIFRYLKEDIDNTDYHQEVAQKSPSPPPQLQQTNSQKSYSPNPVSKPMQSPPKPQPTTPVIHHHPIVEPISAPVAAPTVAPTPAVERIPSPPPKQRSPSPIQKKKEVDIITSPKSSASLVDKKIEDKNVWGASAPPTQQPPKKHNKQPKQQQDKQQQDTQQQEKTISPPTTAESEPKQPKSWANLAGGLPIKQTTPDKENIKSVDSGFVSKPITKKFDHNTKPRGGGGFEGSGVYARNGNGEKIMDTKEFKEFKEEKSVFLAKQEEKDKHSVYLRNVFEEITDDEIREALGKIGVVKSVDRVPGKTISFVEFESIESVSKAIGKPIQIGSGLTVTPEERRRTSFNNNWGRGGYRGGRGYYGGRGNRGGRGVGKKD